MDKRPKVSIVVPVHDIPKGDFFFKRLETSIRMQTFKDFEVVITQDGLMAENTNSAIKQAKGELIKILYMDDYFTHKDSLQRIVDAFRGQWLVTGCNHDPVGGDHFPTYNDRIHEGINTIGSPSVLTIKNDNPLLFDERMSWLLDCDYYKRMHDKFGDPVFLNDINVTIGVGEHQTTHTLPDETKNDEYKLIAKKYENN